MAMHENDRTGADSLLGQRVLRELACASWSEVKERAQSASDEVFPRLYAVVATVAEWIESPTETREQTAARNSARGILRAAAFDLAALAENLAERLKLRGMPFLLAKTGGMIGRSKFLEAQLDELLRGSFPKAEIGLLRISPAEAAARLALRLLSPSNAPSANTSSGDATGH